METTIALAQAIAALGVTGILSLLFILWISGKLHTDKDVSYREQLRLEAVADRRAADARVEKMADAMKESNLLTQRALDLNERLVDEFVRSPTSRTRRSDRD